MDQHHKVFMNGHYLVVRTQVASYPYQAFLLMIKYLSVFHQVPFSAMYALIKVTSLRDYEKEKLLSADVYYAWGKYHSMNWKDLASVTPVLSLAPTQEDLDSIKSPQPRAQQPPIKIPAWSAVISVLIHIVFIILIS